MGKLIDKLTDKAQQYHAQKAYGWSDEKVLKDGEVFSIILESCADIEEVFESEGGLDISWIAATLREKPEITKQVVKLIMDNV